MLVLFYKMLRKIIKTNFINSDQAFYFSLLTIDMVPGPAVLDLSPGSADGLGSKPYKISLV